MKILPELYPSTRVTIKFRKSFEFGSTSRKVLNKFYHGGDRGTSLKLSTNFLNKIFDGWDTVSHKQQIIRFTADPDHDSDPGITSPLRDRANFKNSAGSAALAEVCALRVLLV